MTAESGHTCQNAKARGRTSYFPLRYLAEHSIYVRRSAAHPVEVDVAAIQLSDALCLAPAEAG